MSAQPQHTPEHSKEPAAGQGKIPSWFLVLSIALMVFVVIYIDKNSGSFDSQVFQPVVSTAALSNAQPPSTEGTLTQQGFQIYTTGCATCHQSTGMGDPLKAPPLPGAEWALAPGPNRVVRIVLNGFTGPVSIQGQIWNLNMPPFKENLTDDQIAAVLSYVRNEWGNKASEVKPAQVKTIRETTRDRSTPWTAEELLRVPER